jgi:guanosine-3',5'-bis(diphosphate) 3'-pyrophosphohydrolase
LSDRPGFLSLNLEKALRLASLGHRDQVRKGSGIPYIEHPMAVAMVLDRAGFGEDVVIAGLLHDLVEDTEVTLEQVRESFGESIAAMVGSCSEEKLDAEGRKRPWIDRKRDHLRDLVGASESVKGIILADKLHNLISIRLDLLEGRPVWSGFNAGRDQVLWYYRSMIDGCRSDDPRLGRLSDECMAVLAEIEAPG